MAQAIWILQLTSIRPPSHLCDNKKFPLTRLCNERGDGCAVILEAGLKLTPGLVVTGETVDTGFNENETEFGVLVLAVDGKVFADSVGLLEKVGKVLWVPWSKA